MRVPPRPSRPCVTSESQPGRADPSTSRPAAPPIRRTDQGQHSQPEVGGRGEEGRMGEDMDLWTRRKWQDLTAAFPLIRAHRPGPREPSGRDKERDLERDH